MRMAARVGEQGAHWIQHGGRRAQQGNQPGGTPVLEAHQYWRHTSLYVPCPAAPLHCRAGAGIAGLSTNRKLSTLTRLHDKDGFLSQLRRRRVSVLHRTHRPKPPAP